MPEYTVKFSYDMGFDRRCKDGELTFDAEGLESAKAFLKEHEGGILAPQMRGVKFVQKSLRRKPKPEQIKIGSLIIDIE